MATFDSTKRSLADLIKDITLGKIQLPDFQRGWVWDDEHIRSLLVSVARSFPIGAVMLLETGGEAKFQIRPVEGIALDASVNAERLILDGQQRLTSLTQVLALQKPVDTTDDKKREVQRVYYIDIQKALDGQIEEAFIGVDENRKITKNFGRDVVLDLSTRDLEYENFYFPCSDLLSDSDWLSGLFSHSPHKMAAFFEFQKNVIKTFGNYQLPIIELRKDNGKLAVCVVFEKVNTGGVPLSVFELVTATYAAEGFNLRDDWYGSTLHKIGGRRKKLDKEATLKSIQATDFLQAVTLLHTLQLHQDDLSAGKTGKQVSAVSAKREAILNVPRSTYETWADQLADGFLLAAKFLRKQCIFGVKDLPYRTQVIPLACLLTKLKERWLEPKIYEKLSRWYWCGVLGELYGGAVETRIANDLDEVLNWIEEGDSEPRTVADAGFRPNRLDTLKTRNSAAYKGVHVLMMREGSRDFFWKETVGKLDIEDVAIDIHHIFPKDWCEKATPKISPRIYDSILNKTPISYKANRMIGGKAPSQYLETLQQHKQVGLSDADMDDLLRTHHIDPAFLRADNFQAFMEARKLSLLRLIENAMGKQILPSETDSAIEEEGEEGDEWVAASIGSTA